MAAVRRASGVHATGVRRRPKSERSGTEARAAHGTVHNAVHAEYNYFVKEVRGFSQEEIICDSPDYFTGLARRLSDYLKNVKHTVDELDWRTALSDCLGCPHPTPGWGGSLQLGSDYFTFADQLEAMRDYLKIRIVLS